MTKISKSKSRQTIQGCKFLFVMHVFVWNSIQFVKSNNIEIHQIELNFKQLRLNSRCSFLSGIQFNLSNLITLKYTKLS